VDQSFQAGFGKHHSREDQIIQVTKLISNGFHSRPARYTVAALLDYSKAYERVWRQELIITMYEIGIPMQLLRWLWSFLQNRHARVYYNGSFS